MPFRRKASGVRVTRVLVGTDLSPTSERAVEWAKELAERFEAELLVLQVVSDGPAAAAEELARFAERVAGPQARTRVATGDDPADTIVQAAREEKADVVVLGSAGMQGRKEFLLGNVPNRVSHNAPCTVVIVDTTGSRK
jgi:ubiquinone biosynthesis protein